MGGLKHIEEGDLGEEWSWRPPPQAKLKEKQSDLWMAMIAWLPYRGLVNWQSLNLWDLNLWEFDNYMAKGYGKGEGGGGM